MISTVADLLDALKHQEVKMLDEQKITHAPTIGSMYEGLTRNILELALPIGLDLKVVSGFITNKKGHLSKQIDCMLVKGEGENIPYTDNYKYDVENVIAIVEVKKNLYSSELDSAYKNLASIQSLQETPQSGNILFASAHRQILQSDPRDYVDINQLPLWKRLIGFTLYKESILPIRMALGYHGFTSEFSFREAFINYLGRNLQSSGYSPVDLPNLIISDKYSLIKLSGMPYGIPIFKNRQDMFAAFGLRDDPDDVPPVTTDLWALYASYPANPMLLFLQLLWTRLVYNEKVSGKIFGLDLDVEFVRPLILAKAIEQNGQSGWHYEYFALSEKFLNSIPLSVKWKPVEINMEQAVILTYLGDQERKGLFSISVTDSGLLSELKSRDLLDKNLDLLMKANLVSLEDGILRLLTQECAVIVMPDGRFLAWDNDDPRLMDWLRLNYRP